MASGKKEMVNTAAAAYDNNSVEKPTVQHNSHKIHKRHPFRRALPAITFIIVWLLTLAASTLPGWLKVSTTWVGYSHLNSSTTTSTTTSPFSNSVSVWFICLPDNSAASTTQFFSTLSNLDLTLPNSDTYLSLPWIINITGQFPGCVFVNYWKNQFLVMRIAVLSSLFFGFWGVIKLLGKPYDYVSGLFYLSFHAIPLAIPTIVFTYRTFAHRGLNFITSSSSTTTTTTIINDSNGSYFVLSYSYPFIFAYVALAMDLFIVLPLILSNAAHYKCNQLRPNSFVQVTNQVVSEQQSFVSNDENPFKVYITPASTRTTVPSLSITSNNHSNAIRITRSSQIDIRVEEVVGEDFDDLENNNDNGGDGDLVHIKDSSFARDAYAVAEAQQGLPAGTGLVMQGNNHNNNTSPSGSASSSRRGSIHPDEKKIKNYRQASKNLIVAEGDYHGNPNHVPLGQTQKHHSTHKLENRVVLRFIGQKSTSRISLDDRSPLGDQPKSPTNRDQRKSAQDLMNLSPKSPTSADNRRRSAQDAAAGKSPTSPKQIKRQSAW